jgi:hypothetical protein
LKFFEPEKLLFNLKQMDIKVTLLVKVNSKAHKPEDGEGEYEMSSELL